MAQAPLFHVPHDLPRKSHWWQAESCEDRLPRPIGREGPHCILPGHPVDYPIRTCANGCCFYAAGFVDACGPIPGWRHMCGMHISFCPETGEYLSPTLAFEEDARGE